MANASSYINKKRKKQYRQGLEDAGNWQGKKKKQAIKKKKAKKKG